MTPSAQSVGNQLNHQAYKLGLVQSIRHRTETIQPSAIEVENSNFTILPADKHHIMSQ